MSLYNHLSQGKYVRKLLRAFIAFALMFSVQAAEKRQAPDWLESSPLSKKVKTEEKISESQAPLPASTKVETPNLIPGDPESLQALIEKIRSENIPERTKINSIRYLVYFHETILDMNKKSFKRGEAEGEKNMQVRIAQNLLSQGLTDDQILSATGLTAEELQALNENRAPIIHLKN